MRADQLPFDEFNVPDMNSVLEAAIEKPVAKTVIPSGAAVIAAEAAKNPLSLSSALSIKSNQINQPGPEAEKATTGKVIESAVTSQPAVTGPVTNVTNTTINNISNTNSTDNSSKVSNAKSVDNSNVNATAGESKILEKVSNQLTENSENTTKVISKSSEIVKNQSAVLEKVSNTANSIKESSSTNNVTKIDYKELTKALETPKPDANKGDAAATAVKSPLSKIMDFAKDFAGATGQTESLGFNLDSKDKKSTSKPDAPTSNNVTVKSNKMVESNSVKQILAPDKTLQNTVTELTKTLPEAVNNLSTSVTSINPQNSSVSSVNNEGNQIYQNSNTTINQPAQLSQVPSTETPGANKMEMPHANNDFYLQAIYSALMSGKVKVKLEHQ